MNRTHRALVAATVLITFSGVTASAQQPARKDWTGTLGVATIAMPTYAGSDRYRALPLPLASVEYRGRFFLGASPGGVGAGLGANLVRTPTLSWSLSLSGSDRRPESRGDALAGMGDRGFGLAAATAASVRVGMFQLSGSAMRGFAEGAGWTGSVGAGVTRILGGRWVTTLGAGATFANTRQMEYDFGVGTAQSIVRQGLIQGSDGRLSPGEGSVYSPAGGLQSLQLNSSVAYLVNARWTAIGFLSGSRLQRDAAASPLVRDRHAVMVGTGLSYRW